MSATLDWTKCAKGFELLGTGELKQVNNTHWLGSCPFCDKKGKFYVNSNEVMWDCKVCGEEGNWYTFLKRIAEFNARYFTGAAAMNFARNRDLPPEAFKPWGLGFDGHQYTLPIQAPSGSDKWFVCDIRRKVINGPMMATSGGRIGLFNHRGLRNSSKDEVVYLCEGEWDGIALAWLFNEIGKKHVVVAVPGANTFKDEWLADFDGRHVRVCYDADSPGEKGELKVYGALKDRARRLDFLHWPPDVPNGFDIRDWVKHGAVELRDPKGCYASLHQLFQRYTRLKHGGDSKTADSSSGSGNSSSEKREPPPDVPVEEVSKSFRTWLHMANDDPLAVLFGVIFANQIIDGDPLWVFFVAPPGGMKTELLMSTSLAQCIYSVSTLSAASLCSGMVLPGGADPSLIPKLNEKVLIIKDFTTTMNANPNERDEILGTLRDAYDGKFEKQFGNMAAPRRYNSRFGIIAGVTPSIDAFGSVTTRLGERFLKFRMERDIDELDEKERIRRAILNVGQQAKMREALRETARQFIEGRIARWEGREPVLTNEIAELILELAVFTAKLRGTVDRDKFHPELQNTRASREFGTRLAKQLVILAKGVAIYNNSEQVTEREYRIAALLALGSIPDKTEEVVRALWICSQSGSTGASSHEVSRYCRGISPSTVLRELQDLRMLGVVKHNGTGSMSLWSISKDLKHHIDASGVFRVVDQSITVRKKRVIRRMISAAAVD